MQKKVLVPLVILVVLVAGGGTAYIVNAKRTDTKSSGAPYQTDGERATATSQKPTKNGDAAPTTPPSSSQQSTNPADSQASSTTPASTTTITIKDMAFSPASTTVKKGTALTWTNQDAEAHAIAMADGAAGPHSPQLKTGESYTYTFSQAGTYKYFCALHPSMTATVTVTD